MLAKGHEPRLKCAPVAYQEDVAAPPTELVAGKYQVTRLLGRGGMGSVWEGVHTSLSTRVAIKFIDATYADSVEARSRFENEARAAAALTSKHVVQVYDHGVMPDGRPFIVMEFLKGEPLDTRLDRIGGMPPMDVARLMGQVCRALAKAHSLGIVHRDLKPENIFLVWDDDDGADVAKVVDFGIAKFTDKAMGASSSTRTGSVLGTPYYMSPEQARGLRTVDHRSDLWSLAVITYRCLVGALPFDGDALGDLLVKICTAPIPVPTTQSPNAPPGFDAWFFKAMQREPADRFQTALEFSDNLAVACGMAVARSPQTSQLEASYQQSAHYAAATPGGPTGMLGRSPLIEGTVAGYSNTAPGSSKSRVGLILGGVFGALALIGLVLFFVFSRHPEPSVSAATASPSAAATPSVAAPLAPRPAEPQPAVAAGATPSATPAAVHSAAPAAAHSAPPSTHTRAPAPAAPRQAATVRPPIAPVVPKNRNPAGY